MENSIEIFENSKFGKIRAIDLNGEPYFVGKDIALVLGYANPQKALRDHVDDEDKTVNEMFTVNGTKGVLINESGLYSLIMSSKLPAAKEFKRWVTSEVLPAVRKHGGYLTPQKIEEVLLNPDTIIQLATQLKEERVKTTMLEQRIAEYEPKVQYVDKILASKGTLTVKQIAADYGLTAQQLNRILNEARIQYKVNGQWVLYKEHIGKGYTKSMTYPVSPDRYELHTRWTQKGRLMVHNLLESKGIKANIDKESDATVV